MVIDEKISHKKEAKMIINFSVENWMSFRDETSFSMAAVEGERHEDRIPKVAEYDLSILPIASIYGGNASGKSNFFKALSFVKNFVLGGSGLDSPIPVEPYRLDRVSTEKPSRFKLELLIDEIIYEFSFAVTQKEVVEEKLVKTTSASEEVLYNRQGDKPNFGSSLDEDMRLPFVFAGTRDNQLFLTNSVFQNVNHFRSVYDWFANSLELIDTDGRYGRFNYFFSEKRPSSRIMSQLLPSLDTGISQLREEDVSFDNLPFDEEYKNYLKQVAKEGAIFSLPPSLKKERFYVTRKDGKLVAKKLVTFHARNDGTESRFDMDQESDGTQRVIDLLLLFFEVSVSHSRRVCIIDEADRSLHPVLTRRLIMAYLSTCRPESRAQLLITTHDLHLMDQKLFRRDEMWIAERHEEGCSELRSICEYEDAENDKDIRKSYLQGRMGGIPDLPLFSSFLMEKEEGD